MKKIHGGWNLASAKMSKDAGKVFSTFACGGGSTMGYKLAGFDVIGANEIDPLILEVYRANHKPRLEFMCSIREMINSALPDELHDLDILDGSPPCTSFSSAGVRDRDWGEVKRFQEGQALQRLDDLFFEFLELARITQPRVIVGENVVGMTIGKAKGYIKEVLETFEAIGYRPQLFKLNGARMGVPQVRKRLFFIAIRKDLEVPRLRLDFREKPISFRDVAESLKVGNNALGEDLSLTPDMWKYWPKCRPGKNLATVHPKGTYFNTYKASMNHPVPCMIANHGSRPLHPTEPRYFTLEEWIRCSTFPDDFEWTSGPAKARWMMGMSVPPFMVQRVALELRRQWGAVFRGGQIK
jgi:DNA (cytosine-5)-methyltransferase 1